MDYIAYYNEIADLQGIDPQATARSRDAEGTFPPEAKTLLYNISAEIKNTYHEPGCSLPPLLEGCTVVDLCCGSGRDVYLAAQLVGPGGNVIGVEPVKRRLATAEKYLKKEIKQFGYGTSNVELVHGVPEDLSFIPDSSVDVVTSNCTFSLSPDKDQYMAEVKRILKEGGEFYFTDVFTDRRIPAELADDMNLRALRLGGALYIEDFRRLAVAHGFLDPRYLITRKTPMTEQEQSLFPDIAFATITTRLINTVLVEDICESYGETVTYQGTLPDYPDFFLFDKDIRFPTGETRTICGNVSGLIKSSRYRNVFEVTGDRSRHIGATAGDHIIKTAPDYDGVVDEDDIEIQASCC